MSPRLRIWGACRALAVRSRPVAPRAESFVNSLPKARWYSDEKPSGTPKPIEPESNITKGIEAETPLEPNTETISDAVLEELFLGRPANQSEGGLTAAQEGVLYREGVIPTPEVAEAMEAAAEKAELVAEADGTELENPGHKFGLPTLPSEGYNLKKRYHPVLEQITRLLMRDGKLGAAQRNMAIVMNQLRTSPPPIYSPKYPLLPGSPPASFLPLNPILYITVAIDSVAPLMKVKNIAGAGGGGRALELPIPLSLRQRRRTAFMWILDIVNKKPSKGSGRKQFPSRIAEEIIAVVEGRSSVWEKRKQVHKLGVLSRANIGSNKLRVKKKM